MVSQSPSASRLMLYNTLTRKKEEFQPLNPPQVRMYSCGPTVYDYFHLGNARTFVAADMIRRYLEYRGFEVRFAQNITDINDKINDRARELGCSPAELAEKYTAIFKESTERLGIRPANFQPRASEYVDKMIDMIRVLEEEGYAYASGGDVYFRVRKFADYGKLSGKKADDQLSGARVEVSEHKEDPLDFALWKAAREGEPSWLSPWGEGWPGWHIECSVMSTDLFGDTLDIHMGGADLVFPHHENEIAQSEAATGKPFSRYWLHVGFLNVNNEKMSKSLGNFWTIDQVLDKFEPAVVRYFLLSAHYHAPMDFSDAALKDAAAALHRLREARRLAKRLADGMRPRGEFTNAVEKMHNAFREAMDDDFNTPRALAALFECATAINQIGNRSLEAEKQGAMLSDDDRAQAADLGAVLDELAGNVLGIQLDMPDDDAMSDLTESLMRILIEIRAMARKEKHWAMADAIRNQLGDLGIVLHDRPNGQTDWERGDPSQD